jgi:hypothetical protein
MCRKINGLAGVVKLSLSKREETLPGSIRQNNFIFRINYYLPGIIFA